MSRTLLRVTTYLATFMFISYVLGWSQQQKQSQPPGRGVEQWVLRTDGIGPVRVGMTLAELNRVLQEGFRMPTDKDERGCFYVSSTRHMGVHFMVEDGRVSRIDVASRGFPTDKGIQVGDPERQVFATYGRALKVRQNAYSDVKGDNELLLPLGRYAMQFSTSAGRVNAILSGRISSVQYIEGCL